MSKISLSKILHISVIFAVMLCNSCSKTPGSVTVQSFQITPGTNVGPLAFGMTKDQIQAAIGGPDFQQGKILNYNKLGLTIALNKGGTLGSIICGSMDGDTNLIANFKGVSKDGVKLGASSQEVVSAYGKPDETRDNGAFYRYDHLSMDFAFKDDRLICIVVRPHN